MKIGTRVVIERDEEKYRSNSVWRRFAGKTGVVTAVVRGVGLTEYGVSFSKDTHTDAYFKRYELTERK
ncbi:hypothetical protein SEA_JEEVES_56 [Mycobacterium phage Jeeves]|uniref:Uncharacterized protein n=1 Tax=Mycobacterium phage Jeeves TaxID=2652402 RepID=A0A5J6T469_9CAUD|nr:hypothetical protein KNU75_gp053 [Mycobacterium phage Jeeves]QFG04531.1 hypothetical protein SEA_JEEVES_56 [Mycobacterium phage Jeeves]